MQRMRPYQASASVSNVPGLFPQREAGRKAYKAVRMEDLDGAKSGCFGDYADIQAHDPDDRIDTACSGSHVSADVACRYLQSDEIDGAIIGAANLYLSTLRAMKGASSLSGRCHTFDVKADRYIKAGGVNAVILKRLSDSIQDGNPIRAVIRDSATNSDGRTPILLAQATRASRILAAHLMPWYWHLPFALFAKPSMWLVAE
ncbi:MAG: hypothetical protein Q9221_003661 [Calogaya cf. arnoldii]